MRPKLVEDFVVDEGIVVFPQVVEFALHSAEFPGVYLCQSLHFKLSDKQLKGMSSLVMDVCSHEKI